MKFIPIAYMVMFMAVNCNSQEAIIKSLKQWPDWLVNGTERPTQRTTFPAYKHWEKDSELLPSGLLGLVKIIIYKKELLK